jgi:hypothetical protein
MVITGVADRIPERTGARPFDAFIPQDGQSLFDINIPANTQRRDGAGASGGLGSGAFGAYFGVNAVDAATVDELATPHPIGSSPGSQTSPAPTGREKISTHGTVLPREPFEVLRAGEINGWGARAACGHDVMLDMPQQTAELLETMP